MVRAAEPGISERRDHQRMPESRRASTAPWIAAAVAGAVLVALLITYFVALRPAQSEVNGDLTATETAAVNAAAGEMVNLLSFRRAQFDADYQRALDGATGSLKSDVQKNKSVTKSTMTKGKFDLVGKVTHKALEGPANSGKTKGYVVLVTVNGYRSTTMDQPVQQSLEVTVVQSKGKWLASDVTNIGVGQ
jgi:hypothetical protein